MGFRVLTGLWFRSHLPSLDESATNGCRFRCGTAMCFGTRTTH